MKAQKTHVLADNGSYGLCMVASNDFRITPATVVICGKLNGKAEDVKLGRMVRVFLADDGRVFWVYSDWSTRRIR